MDAVVDETGVALVIVLALPDRDEERRECRLPSGILHTAGEFAPHRGDGPETAREDLLRQLGFAQRDRWHVIVDRRVVLDLAAGEPGHEILDLTFARAAAHAGARGIHDGFGCRLAGFHAGRDRTFGDAVAIADLHIGRHFVEGDLRAWRAEVEKQREAFLGERRVPVKPPASERRPSRYRPSECRRRGGHRARSASCRCRASAR